MAVVNINSGNGLQTGAPSGPTGGVVNPSPLNFGAGAGGGGGSPAASGGGPMSAYRQDVGGYNPFQYATDDTTNSLAKLFGATAGKTTDPNGPGGIGFGPPSQNMLDFGGGYVGNAGLTQQFIDAFGLDRARQMFADQQAYSQNNKMGDGPMLGIGTDPSLQGYNPNLSQPTTFGQRANFGASPSSFYNNPRSGGQMPQMPGAQPPQMGQPPSAGPGGGMGGPGMGGPQQPPFGGGGFPGFGGGGFGGGFGGGRMPQFGGYNQWGNPFQGNPFGMMGGGFGGGSNMYGFGGGGMGGGMMNPWMGGGGGMMGGIAGLLNQVQGLRRGGGGGMPMPWSSSPNTGMYFPQFY